MNRRTPIDEPRYLLTELGMRSIAARAGVPPAIYARHGGVTFVSAQPSPSRQVVRHREHTLGVNRFAARLAVDARAAGWRLAEWRNEAESTHRFVAEDGRIAWVRPDASGVLVRGAELRRVPPRVRPRNARLGRLPREVRGVPALLRGTGMGRPLPASAHVAFRVQRSPRGAQRPASGERVDGPGRCARDRRMAKRGGGTTHGVPVP